MQSASHPAPESQSTRDPLGPPNFTPPGTVNWRAGVGSALVRGNIFLSANLHGGALSAIRATLAAVFSAVFAARP